MNLHYVAATMLWISVCLFQQEAYSRDLPTNKKAAMIQKAPEKSEKKDFCDNIVDKLKDILLSSKSESTKIADIKALANESFDMPRIYAKATSQIKKKHSLDSKTEAELNTAILNYLCRKYVALTKDYRNSNNVKVLRTSSVTSNGVQKVSYKIMTGRKAFNVSAFATNNKITDIIISNVSLIDPLAFDRKLNSSMFKGDLPLLISWLNNPSSYNNKEKRQRTR